MQFLNQEMKEYTCLTSFTFSSYGICVSFFDTAQVVCYSCQWHCKFVGTLGTLVQGQN